MLSCPLTCEKSSMFCSEFACMNSVLSCPAFACMNSVLSCPAFTCMKSNLSCPAFTCMKSNLSCPAFTSAPLTSHSFLFSSVVRKNADKSCISRIGTTVSPGTIRHSSTFAQGTTSRCIPSFCSCKAMGSAPSVLCTSPLRASSPKKAVLSRPSFFTIPIHASMAVAIARSYPVPSFLICAGDRLTVMRATGSGNPAFFMATRTLSFASLTSHARLPTISNPGRPLETSASTRTL